MIIKFPRIVFDVLHCGLECIKRRPMLQAIGFSKNADHFISFQFKFDLIRAEALIISSLERSGYIHHGY